MFGTSLWLDDELRSVAIAGRPTGRGFDDGLTVDGKVRFPVFIRERDPRDVDPKVVALLTKK
jgi:hypothetical protein